MLNSFCPVSCRRPITSSVRLIISNSFITVLLYTVLLFVPLLQETFVFLMLYSQNIIFINTAAHLEFHNFSSFVFFVALSRPRNLYVVYDTTSSERCQLITGFKHFIGYSEVYCCSTPVELFFASDIREYFFKRISLLFHIMETLWA